MADKKGLLSFLKLNGIIDNLLKLLEAKIEIAKIEIKKDIAKFLAKVMVFAILMALGLLFFLFLNIGLAFLLSDWIGQLYSGFLIISGFYVAVFFVFLLVKDHLGIEDSIEQSLNKALEKSE
ncbi:MAG: phage holin family protein [Bacteroidota bacterium]